MRSSSTLVWDIIDNDTRLARPQSCKARFPGIAGESDEAKVSQVEQASCTLTTELIYHHPN